MDEGCVWVVSCLLVLMVPCDALQWQHKACKAAVCAA